MRLLTGPRPLLILPTLALALACASPKPSAEEAVVQSAPPAEAEASVAEMSSAEEEAAPGTAPAPAPGNAPPRRAESNKAKADGLADRAADDADSSVSAGLDIEVPMINGGLNRDIIRRTASDHADEIRGCHGRALAAMPELAGTLVLALKIDDEGHVSEAKLGESSALANRDVEDCVLELARGWQFPGGAKPTTVELAFGLGLE